jgi:hypothetical protein
MPRSRKGEKVGNTVFEKFRYVKFVLFVLALLQRFGWTLLGRVRSAHRSPEASVVGSLLVTVGRAFSWKPSVVAGGAPPHCDRSFESRSPVAWPFGAHAFGRPWQYTRRSSEARWPRGRSYGFGAARDSLASLWSVLRSFDARFLITVTYRHAARDRELATSHSGWHCPQWQRPRLRQECHRQQCRSQELLEHVVHSLRPEHRFCPSS